MNFEIIHSGETPKRIRKFNEIFFVAENVKDCGKLFVLQFVEITRIKYAFPIHGLQNDFKVE